MRERFSAKQTVAHWLITKNSQSFISLKGVQGGPYQEKSLLQLRNKIVPAHFKFYSIAVCC